MAAPVGSGAGEADEVSDINVTPMIDGMLVLLIISMVAAPLSTVDVAVDLPASTARPQPRPSKPLFVTLKADLSLSLGSDRVDRARLPGLPGIAAEGDKDTRIFLRADHSVPYGEVMRLLNAIRQAGYLKVALVGLEQAS